MSDDEKDSNRNEIASLAVAAVALAVALVALLGTTAQVLQQYIATAAGYSNCGKRVIGPWAKHTKLVFHPWELRFEVIFMSPAIEVRPARLNIANQQAVLVGGLPEIFLITKSGLLGFSNADTEKMARDCLKPTEEGLGYAASWLTLLREIQVMTPTAARTRSNDNTDVAGLEISGLLLTIKAVNQTLDLMPEGVKRPYAITTLGSVVLLVARLGLHWKQFDRVNDRYLADGNGLLITGSAVPHLGIMFSFTRYGFPSHVHCPAIEDDEAAKLCFGLAPTIFKSERFGPGPKYLTDIPRNLDFLRLGSRAEMTATFRLMGFEPNNQGFMASVESTEHLFPGQSVEHHYTWFVATEKISQLMHATPTPVVFEIVGMLVRSFNAVAGSVAGPHREQDILLPNPLPFHWDSKTFSPDSLLRAYADLAYHRYKRVWQSLGFTENVFQHPYLTERPSQIVSMCDGWLSDNTLTRQEVLIVVRAHVKHVTQVFNDGITSRDFQAVYATVGTMSRAGTASVETELVEIYLDKILPRVLQDAGSWVGDMEKLDAERKQEIWLVLMLRMFGWFTTHTFHPADIQLPKSDVMGSEQPVYIS